jgi:uncharacterized membrane protein
MRIRSLGHLAFAAIMIALGVQGLITGAFAPVWQPVPHGVPARDELAYLIAGISLASGVGLLWTRTAAASARLLGGVLLLWWLLFRVRAIVRAPGVFGAWDGGAETTVMVAAAWVLYIWCATPWDRQHLRWVADERALRFARGLFGLALIPFGLAHFIYLKETVTLVPHWLPFHIAWAYVTGSAFLAAGLAVLTGVWARLAASLSALEIGLFTLLVWVPIVAGGSADASSWSEFGVSLALTASAWVVADSYRDRAGRKPTAEGSMAW